MTRVFKDPTRRVVLMGGVAALAACSRNQSGGVNYCNAIDGEGDRDGSSVSHVQFPPAPYLLRIRHEGIVDYRSALTWPARAQAPDYRHLLHKARDGDEFTLTPALLQRLADANAFLMPRGQIHLFGLRGCVALDAVASQTPSDAIKLKVADPDHIEARCVIGVWDRRQERDLVSAFTASTVPSGFYTREQASVPTNIDFEAQDVPDDALRVQDEYFRRSNLLPCGLYAYVRGDHGRGKPCVDANWRPGIAPPGGLVPNAFRAEAIAGTPGEVCPSLGRQDLVLRVLSKLEYNIDQGWDLSHPFNNLHPARTKQLEGWKPNSELDDEALSKFSSAGCQVVEGDFQSGEHDGPWNTFREQAQAIDAPFFQYMLLTGDEAFHLSTEAHAMGVTSCLRIGSTGTPVASLLEKLRGRPSGNLLRARDMRDIMGAIPRLRAPVIVTAELEDIKRELGQVAIVAEQCDD